MCLSLSIFCLVVPINFDILAENINSTSFFLDLSLLFEHQILLEHSVQLQPQIAEAEQTEEIFS